METATVRGELIYRFKTQQLTKKNGDPMLKGSFVIKLEGSGQYEKFLKLSTINQGILSLVEDCKLKSILEVSYVGDSRQWLKNQEPVLDKNGEPQYFNDIVAVNVKVADIQVEKGTRKSFVKEDKSPEPPATGIYANSNGEDDLPF